MKRGDIVLITFPFSDLKGIKVRPAVVISSDNYNQKGQDALFMLISSNISSPRSSDYFITNSHLDFKTTGLKQSSLVKVDKIVSLLQGICKRKLGVLSKDMQESIDKILISVLGLNVVPK